MASHTALRDFFGKRRLRKFIRHALGGALLGSAGCSLMLDTNELRVSGSAGGGNGSTASGGSAGSFAGQSGSSGGSSAAGVSGNENIAGSSGSAGAAATAGSSFGGTGGDAGSAGASGDSQGGASGDASILFYVDDMEDGDRRGRLLGPEDVAIMFGYWYATGDGTAGATQFPGEPFVMSELSENERPGSQYAARSYGSGFTDWGAILGIAMSTGAASFDASQFCSVRFWARGTPRSILFEIGDRFTDEGGGLCSQTGTDPYPCYRHAAVSFDVTSSWQEYEFAFTEFTHPDGPAVAELDKSELHSIQFAFRPGAFDLWVDDLAFRTCPSNPRR